MIDPLIGFVLALIPVLAIAGAGHALLYKRDPRSAFAWIAICLVFPLAGPLLYFLFGINRVRTRARLLTRRFPFHLGVAYERGDYGVPDPVVEPIRLPPEWRALARVSDAVTRRPLVEGNAAEALHNGEAAFPAMLEAIEAAHSRVWLATYIFETGPTGRRFIDALARAFQRGVDVRVLIDGVGELYSLPWAGVLLRRRGVRVSRFMRPRLWPPQVHINLRNHRKILVVDGAVAFVGGINLGDRHLAGDADNPGRVVDMHFRLRGPIVTQVETVFAEDWRFTTGEITPPTARPAPDAAGKAICRSFTDGPNEDLDRLTLVLTGAISTARERIDIMTPYFIPPPGLVAALQAAVLRGVRVSVLLPGRNNLPFVHWATRNLLWELLQFDIEVRYQPPPFVHTKLFVVDAHYAIVGSANLDPRSLRLNFELAVEIFDHALGAELCAHFDRGLEASQRITLEELDARSLPVRTRDALCWLFTPYL